MNIYDNVESHTGFEVGFVLSNSEVVQAKYKVNKIEQNYNQIWYGIKANKSIIVNYNFTLG